MRRVFIPQMKGIVLTLLFWIGSFGCWSQSVIEIEKRAYQAFNNGQFETAKVDFQTLYSRDPKSPTYNFYYAQCLFNTGERSISLNHFMLATTLGNGICEANYFIGRIHHLNYDFTRAIAAYKDYLTCFPNDERNAQVQIEQCNHGKELLKNPQPISVKSAIQLPLNGFLSRIEFSDFNVGGGYYTDLTLQSKMDKKNNFIPHTYVKAGNSVKIYASYGESATQIGLFLKTKNGDTWSNPVKIPLSAGTQNNLWYPYFDQKHQMLYFSSNGFNSLGGYDFFKVAFDPFAMRLGEVTNVGFPFSSSDDDFLFIPIDSAANHAFFTTIRNSPPGKIELVEARLEKATSNLVAVKGKFEDLVNPKNTRVQIKVKDLERGIEYGPFISDSSGNYQMILPGNGSYEFVANITGTQAVFTDKKVLPNQPSEVVFEQNIQYSMRDGKEQAAFDYQWNSKANDQWLGLKSLNIASLNKTLNPKTASTPSQTNLNQVLDVSTSLKELGFSGANVEEQAQGLADKLLEISNIGEDFKDNLEYLDKDRNTTIAQIRNLNSAVESLKQRIQSDTSVAAKRVYQRYLSEVYDSLIIATNALATNNSLTQQTENNRRQWNQKKMEQQAIDLSDSLRLKLLTNNEAGIRSIIQANQDTLNRLLKLAKNSNNDSLRIVAQQQEKKSLNEDLSSLEIRLQQATMKLQEFQNQYPSASKKEKTTLDQSIQDQQDAIMRLQRLKEIKESEYSTLQMEEASLQKKMSFLKNTGFTPSLTPDIQPDFREVNDLTMAQTQLKKQIAATEKTKQDPVNYRLDSLNAQWQVVKMKMETATGANAENLSNESQRLEAALESAKESYLAQRQSLQTTTIVEPKNATATNGTNEQPKNETASNGTN
ncbi:MAG: hypothetical protein EBS17_01605, partial [Flavobacteriia bacterium]|nr:hypothetical protein [Flavobacteriia bacterium]